LDIKNLKYNQIYPRDISSKMSLQTYVSSNLDTSTKRKLFGADNSSYTVPIDYQVPTLTQRKAFNNIVGKYDTVIQIGGYGFWSHNLIEIARKRLVLGNTNTISEHNNNILQESLKSKKVQMFKVDNIADSTIGLIKVAKEGIKSKKINSYLVLLTLEDELLTNTLMNKILKVFNDSKTLMNQSLWILLRKSQKLSKIKKSSLFTFKAIKDTDKGLMYENQFTFYTSDVLSKRFIYTDSYSFDESILPNSDKMCQWLK